MCIACFLIVKCTKLSLRFLVFCYFQVWKWSSYVNRKFGGISESAHSSGPIWPNFLFMSKVRILMRFAISWHKIKNQHFSCLRQFCYVTKLPQADIEVILLRSTMSHLGNTPPPGDQIGSHKHFFEWHFQRKEFYIFMILNFFWCPIRFWKCNEMSSIDPIL